MDLPPETNHLVVSPRPSKVKGVLSRINEAPGQHLAVAEIGAAAAFWVKNEGFF